MTSIFWFRKDLRVRDNPGLYDASRYGPVIPVYIDDPEENAGPMSRLWLSKSLAKLNQSLNGALSIYVGSPIELIPKLVLENKIKHVFWNRCYEPWRRESDQKVVHALEQMGIEYKNFNASLLWEPDTILKQDGTSYKVFTPFYKKGCLSAEEPREIVEAPDLKTIKSTVPADGLNIQPKEWHKKFDLQVGEEVAHSKVVDFINHRLTNYKEGRNFPASAHTSHLSNHLHFGEISPNQIWYSVKDITHSPKHDVEHFLSELAWREFSYYLLYHFPGLPERNFQPKFNKFPWRMTQEKQAHLSLWQKGMTGYPIVDAAMRELWQTGYMHNRCRMIVASFLIKNLLIHWHYGRDWFWDCLSDADLANNSASWQWVAGCGADAAPYFRIFNPVLQSEKFDPDGVYIRRFVPEVANLPTKYIHAPWTAPEDVLTHAHVVLGTTYPHRIIDFATSRDLSLQYFKSIGESPANDQS